MNMEERLKQKIKKEEKISIIFGAILCTMLLVLIIVAIVGRLKEVKESGTEITWLNFGIVFLIIAFVVNFVKFILIVCLDLKKDDAEKYEKLKVVAIRVKTTKSVWGAFTLVENIETGEQFTVDGGGNMKENETYYMLRSKRTKIYACEPFDPNTPED